MNIRKYFAPDMRRAIHLVRTEHGPDAVILSSESVDGGIEIVAAVDYDPTLMTQMLGRREQTAREAIDTPEDHHDGAESETGSVTRADAAGGSAPAPEHTPEAGGPAADAAERPAARLATTSAAGVPGRSASMQAAAPGTDADATRELRAIKQDLFALKGLVRDRLAWADLRATTPQRNWLMRRAEAFGLTAELADTLVREVEHPEIDDRAWREVVFGLARRLIVMREDPIEQGGVFALVGPTGVGKTTTIAKLAARHCLRHGRDSLAIITTDSYRIGAQRQLEAFGAILGVPVRTADSPEKLARLLDELADRRLVLIDTAGMAPRDTEMAKQLANLDANPGIRRYLVLAANMQAAVMQDAVRAFGGRDLAGAVLTKLDETNAPGAAISVLINSKLPAVWLSDGQRVPEDLKLARVAGLLKSAAPTQPTDDELMVPAFGRDVDDTVGEGSATDAGF